MRLRQASGEPARRGVVLGMVVGLMATLVATAIAGAHGGDPAQIHACVKDNGAVRIVGPNDDCGPGQTPVDWSIQGPPGPAGPPGTAVAYALIQDNPGDVVRESRSLNITDANVVKPAGTQGVYCFVDLPFDFDVFVAAPVFGPSAAVANGGDTRIFGIVPHPCNRPSDGGLIPGGSDLWIDVRDYSGNLVDGAFYIIFN